LPNGSQFSSKENLFDRLIFILRGHSVKQRGFISDVIDVFLTYNLLNYLQTWLTNCLFPSKYIWEKNVRSALSTHQKTQRDHRMINDSDFHRFLSIIQHQRPSFIWTIPTNSYEITLCKFICKLNATPLMQTSDICRFCDSIFLDIFKHITCSCSLTLTLRDSWLDEISNNLDIILFAELCAMTDDEMFLFLLGRNSFPCIPGLDQQSLKLLNFLYVRNAATLYNRTLKNAA
jgi:hypothetical protein